METPKYRKGDCVEYPKAEKWGFGIVLEDCQDEHLRVFFSIGGYKVLHTEGLSISKVGRWPNLDFSTGKVSCPFCNRQVEDLKKHSCRPKTSKKGGTIFFVGLGGKKVKYKVRPDDPMRYPYEAYRPKKNMEIPKYRKWDRVEYPQKKQWGTGTVLEDCEGKNIHIRFDRGGHKILPTEGLNLTRAGRRRYLNISTGKDRGLKKT